LIFRRARTAKAPFDKGIYRGLPDLLMGTVHIPFSRSMSFHLAEDLCFRRVFSPSLPPSHFESCFISGLWLK
jgi:hypothetical protein